MRCDLNLAHYAGARDSLKPSNPLRVRTALPQCGLKIRRSSHLEATLTMKLDWESEAESVAAELLPRLGHNSR